MITSQKIVKLINGKLYGDSNLNIEGAFDLIPGKKSHVSFLNNNVHPSELSKTESDLIIISENIDYSNISKSVILVEDPKKSFFLSS